MNYCLNHKASNTIKECLTTSSKADCTKFLQVVAAVFCGYKPPWLHSTPIKPVSN